MDNLFTSSTRLRFTQVGVLHGHTGEVLLVSFAPDGLQLASFSKPDTLCLWDVIQQRIVRVLSETGEVIAIAFSYDGRYLAAAYSNGSVQLWALQGEPVGELQVHQYGVAGLAFLPEHHILVTLDGSGLIRFWEIPANKVLTSFCAIPDGARHIFAQRLLNSDIGVRGNLALSPSGTSLAILYPCQQGTVHIWGSLSKGTRPEWVTSLGVQGIYIDQILFSPDGRFLALNVWDRAHPYKYEIQLYESQSWTLVGAIGSFSQAEMAGKELQQIAFSPDGKWLGGVCFDGHLDVWDVASRRLITSASLHPWENSPAFADSRCFDWSPNAKVLAVGGWDHIDWRKYQDIISTSGWSTLPGEPSAVDFVIRFWQVNEEKAYLITSS